MGDRTEIAWCDSTFNCWWGCTGVSPACERCYAERLDRRTGGDHWGPRNTPRVMSEAYWQKPLQWERHHVAFADAHGGRRRRVFCGSMMDWADKNAPEGQRDRLWRLIRATPNLDWLLLTKRAVNIRKYLPNDWGDGYPNVWLGVSAENKRHGLARVDRLRDIPAKVRFISAEPLLECLGAVNLAGIDWVIVGGESGPSARPMHPAWVRSLRDQCEEASVAFFFKQWGEWQPIAPSQWDGESRRLVVHEDGRLCLLRRDDGHAGEPSEAFVHPLPALMQRVGKERAGYLFEGVEYRVWPSDHSTTSRG